MMHLLTASQTRQADQYTIQQRKISADDLMEDAVNAFCRTFIATFPDKHQFISVYCGTGNNGGDGLAIARLLVREGYQQVTVKIAPFNRSRAEGFRLNLGRVESLRIPVTELSADGFPDESQATVLIDALLGSGLNKPLTGSWQLLVRHLNNSGRPIVSVDIPTGFPAEGPVGDPEDFIHATLVITFQLPKINFFFPESEKAIAEFKVVDIGLDPEFISGQQSGFTLVTDAAVRTLLQPRRPFSHKGTYGHTLIIAGKSETMGAALLCSEASLFTGAGLTTAFVPRDGLTALNVRSPEVIAIIRIAGSPLPKIDKYTAILAGPGFGTDQEAIAIIRQLIDARPGKLVLDADALTILSKDPQLLDKLPAETILTPHMKEFDRLFGAHEHWWARVQTARKYASLKRLVIVLKNRYTFIILPDGQVMINPTGSPAMATGGMGDVLAGMAVSLLAQGYAAGETAMLATYIHGLCGAQYEGMVCPAAELVKLIPAKMKALIH
ncbi:NAD(P)H-hydrate dehydratase [Hufsiella ginkgonis]|uniref:Bifunctional NAD(P)H-hydrate repair enzyme n=1 Tax=Hufsiella ginkgonis TaxID=2695274 RepID=A0A7K1Y5L0_9SPHI|nr:NAD(P)H-hydrate dehydratase [Hufsiella ginkgonis]MXV17996.1 NAD(P)H-hydrate dehydratase [Hufsiella ginkgonis]